jgi:hypothetical protein
MSFAAFTPLIMVGFLVAWALTDSALDLFGGNDSTFSKTTLRMSVHGRALARALPYAVGALMAHLLNPRLTASPTFVVGFLRAALACVPVLWLIVQVVTARQGTDAELTAFYARTNAWVIALELVAWYSAGVVVGSTVVPQHIGQ